MGTTERDGYLQGLLAYGLWGLFPLYFAMFAHISSLEVVAHRVVWCLVTCLGLLAITRRFPDLLLALRDRRLRSYLAVAGVLIAVNWLGYVYGVATGRTLDAALGYFIIPVATTALGVVVLGERLRPLQWAAVALGALAVVVLLVGYGRLPWIALALALSFGTYGLVKKLASRSTGPLPGMALETGTLLPVALGYLIFLGATGRASVPLASWDTLLLASTGVVTAVPLLLFASATARIPLVGIGVLQYLAPIIQFLLGWLVFHEPMPPARWGGFALVWAAIVLFVIDALRAAGILGRCASSTNDPAKT